MELQERQYIDKELSESLTKNLYEMDYKLVANHYEKSEPLRRAAWSTLRAVAKMDRRISMNNAEPLLVLARIAKQRAESTKFMKNNQSKMLDEFTESIPEAMKTKIEKVLKKLEK
jgi:uncharacterized protein YqeY